MDIILHGCNGRMGRVLAHIIGETEGLRVSAGIDSAETGEEGFPVYPSLDAQDVAGDVVIDFSHFSAVGGLLKSCMAKNLPVVIATTGIGEEEQAAIGDASQKIPVFRSANMSLGINLLVKAIKDIAPFLEEDFHMEIIEKHHAMKKDSPSGTALLLADAVNSSLEEEKELIFGRHGKEDECKLSQMGIHAVRGGTIPGEHTVLFAGPDEVIALNHSALSRDIFARGALKAARYIAGREPGLYSMEDIVRG
jgi:4-hydroxy-tetrahydrodipicolinate reductase